MAKVIVILLIALVVESVGVAFLSRGLKQVGEIKQINVPEIAGLIKRGAANRNLLAGVLFETVFFIALLYLLSSYDVSLIWPLTALGFVLTTFMAKFFLEERVSGLRWTGVGLIVMGAAIVSYSEKIKDKKPVAPPASADVSAHPH
jgi:drug/metabolite transporter (DMT)-like permease